MMERNKCMNAPEIRFKGFKGKWYSIPLSNPDFTIIAGGDIDNKFNSSKLLIKVISRFFVFTLFLSLHLLIIGTS